MTKITHVPYAVFEEKDDSTPLQIFTRLHGFSYSYPGSGFTIRGVLLELGGPEVFGGQGFTPETVAIDLGQAGNSGPVDG